jgi:tRNA(Ile)-lysidine synthase
MKKGTVPFLATVEAALGRLLPAWPEARLCVALSGGVDSIALLQACHALAENHRQLELRAVHVHHGLQAAADVWAHHCQLLCERLAVPLQVIHLGLAPRAGESVEAEAREARYAALAERLLPGEVLLTAHHQDDQCETLLLQLFRGAGVAGLAAMPAATPLGTGRHLRPLLDSSRAAIEDYARQAGLEWVEDPMNEAARFDRAFLRQQVTPLLRGRWPAVARTVARSAGHIAEAQGLLAALAAIDGEPLLDEDGHLAVAGLLALPRARQANVLRWWLRRQGLGPPSSARLGAIIDDVLPAQAGAQPVVTWKTGEVRRYRGQLYPMRPLGPPPPPGWKQTIRPGGCVQLPCGLGRISLQSVQVCRLDLDLTVVQLEIRFPDSHGRRLRLAEMLRRSRVEPWWRRRTPLLWAGDQLLAAADSRLDRSIRGEAAPPLLTWARE